MAAVVPGLAAGLQMLLPDASPEEVRGALEAVLEQPGDPPAYGTWVDAIVAGGGDSVAALQAVSVENLRLVGLLPLHAAVCMARIWTRAGANCSSSLKTIHHGTIQRLPDEER